VCVCVLRLVSVLPVFFGQLLMDPRQASHGLSGLARMRRVMPGFPGEPGFSFFVRPGQFFMDFGVVFMFESVLGEVFRQLEVIAGCLVGLREILKFSF